MTRLERGDTIREIGTDQNLTVLGREDYAGYDYNRPNTDWELVADGENRYWVSAYNGAYELA
jgi:hypothetical protein